MPEGVNSAMSGPVAVVLNLRRPAKTLHYLRSLAGEGVARVVLVENSEDDGGSMHAMQPGLEGVRQALRSMSWTRAGALDLRRALTGRWPAS